MMMCLPNDLIKMIVSYVPLQQKIRIYSNIHNHKLRNCLKSDVELIEYSEKYITERHRMIVEDMNRRNLPLDDDDGIRNHIVYCKICRAPVRKFNMTKHLKKHVNEPPQSGWRWDHRKGDMIKFPTYTRCHRCKLILYPYGYKIKWRRYRGSIYEAHKCPYL